MINRARGFLARMPAPAWMLLAIFLGFACGALFAHDADPVVGASRLLGGLWIEGLRMTILPLVFALVVTGVADLALNNDHAGRSISRRLPVVLGGFLLMSATVASLITPALLEEFRLSPDTVAAFRASVGGASPSPSPSVADTLLMLVPVNVFASAAQGALVPLVVFALIFGIALSRIERTRAAVTLGVFRGLADAMLVVVGWILRLAPLGIFALALVIGATAGLDAAVALGHYILVQVILALTIALISYLLVPLCAGISLLRFARAVAPAQAVAAGTQSSIATLPAMLMSAQRLGLPDRHGTLILSLAVAVFKVTAPSGALVFGLSAAWLAGVDVSMSHVIVAIPMSLLATLLVLGVPGPASVIASTMPTAIALGAPLELIPILLAVDTIPDMFRTVANVTADVAATTIVAAPLTAAPQLGVDERNAP